MFATKARPLVKVNPRMLAVLVAIPIAFRCCPNMTIPLLPGLQEAYGLLLNTNKEHKQKERGKYSTTTIVPELMSQVNRYHSKFVKKM
jgi:hypothetical protein